MGFRLISAAALLAVSLFPFLARADGVPPVATAVELSDEGGAARLTFAVSQPVDAVARPAADPARIFIDLPEVNFQIDPALGKVSQPRADSIVRGFRFGVLSPGKSRIVVDLAKPACVDKAMALPAEGAAKPARLVVELKACEARKFEAEARAMTQVSTLDAPDTPAAPALPVIVLDPGHGGADGGAYGLHGAVEKSIVYEYAQELKRQLDAGHKYKVVMTRDADAYVSLEDRVRVAREANAALMISIHADTIPGSAADVSGTTVYTCSERASDAEAARIAERENAADRAGGGAAPADAAGVADILFDLKRRETRAYAHLFSRGLVTQLGTVGRMNHNPERSAGFVVLKAPDFPSVLVELGYLSNPQDVANMTSPEWRQRGATAMVAAIERFFRPHASGGEADGRPPEAVAASDHAPTALRGSEPPAH